MKLSLRLILFSLFVLAFSAAKAQQQIPNGNFDIWEKTGTKIEPNRWNGLMSADLCMLCSIGASQRVFRDKRTPSGKESCIRIESTSAIGGIIVNGTITTGQVTAPTAMPSQGFNRTVKGDPEFSLKFNGQPDSLVFWAKFSITDKTDSALVSFLLHDDVEMTDPPRSGASNKLVAIAKKVFQTSGEWQHISIPFLYDLRGQKRVRYLLGTFSSSYRAGKGNSRSVLWIDDVELIYAQPSIDVNGQTASTGR